MVKKTAAKPAKGATKKGTKTPATKPVRGGGK